MTQRFDVTIGAHTEVGGPTLVSDADELEVYPISGRERLESHYFLEFHFRRWLTSETRLLADLDVRAVALELFFVAQDQSPVGTLPTDDRLLAKLLGLELSVFQGLCQRQVSPLVNWRRCLCGDEVRLMHPVVLEMAQKALDVRKRRADSNAQDRQRKRLKSLKQRVSDMGVSQIANNALVLERMDEWLEEHCEGYRTEAWIRRAMEEVSLGR